MSDTKIGSGRVPVRLDGKDFVLVPTLEACQEISDMAGGIQGAVQRCQMLNFKTICDIVGSGLEVNGKRLNVGQRDRFIPKAVYEAGLIGISASCIEFCHVVANGGRMPDPDEEEAEEEDGDENPLASPQPSSTDESLSARPAG